MSARRWLLLVSAGTGPIEVRRFVGLLAEHLCELCSERGVMVNEVVVHGDEEAPGSVEIHVVGAAEELSRLEGTHALVARSEDRGKNARKRWYAGVKVFEDEAGAAGGDKVTVGREEVTITVMRASGPGGQHVNKTSSAVRVEHAASGVTVRAMEERSQRQNLTRALERLGAILSEKAREKAAGAKAGRRLAHYRVERGRPSFVYELDRDGGCLRAK